MRKLTKRETSLLAIVSALVLVIVASRFVPPVFERFSGREISKTRAQLQATRNILQLAEFTEQVEEQLRAHVGLQGQTISESLFQEISRYRNIEAFNQARGTSDLAALHPALKGKAETLIAYKTHHGEFENMDALRKIRGPIFEGEQPQAVVSQHISQLARDARLKPDYQLNIKSSPGKKVESIGPQAKRNVLLYLYLSQLDAELNQLRAQKLEKIAQKEAKTEEELERAMFDGWWGAAGSPQDTDEGSKNGGIGTTDPPRVVAKNKVQRSLPPTDYLSESNSAASHNKRSDSETQVETSGDSVTEKLQPLPRAEEEAPKREAETDEKHALNSSQEQYHVQLHLNHDSSTQNRPFSQLPEIIPPVLRMQLIEFIRTRIWLEIDGAAEFKQGFIADQIVRVNNESRRGFTGFKSRPSVVQVRFRTNSILLAKFEELDNQYDEGQLYSPGESTEHSRNYEGQIMALTEYVDGIEQQMEQLHSWFAKVNATHHPEIYIIEMKFKSDVDTVVRFIQSIEGFTKWLHIKNIKLTNDKLGKSKSRLAVDLSMMAKIL